MSVEKIPYDQTNFFSKFILDYLSGAESLTPFYNRAPKLSSFKAQILEKQKQPVNRKVLVEELSQQYSLINTTDSVTRNIQSLLQENTFTVATGHQLCLFTGPLYFIYKIITTINLSEQLKSEYPEYNFVPIYWMASEDHDFDEVNHVHLFGKTLQWNQDQKGAVGAISTESMQSIFDQLKPILGDSLNAKDLYRLLSDSYLENKDLASATRHLVNSLFSKYGLVVLDADSPNLKKEAIPLIKRDVLEKSNYPLIQNTNQGLGEVQAYVRPINFFYLQKGSRNRIEQQGTDFIVCNSDLKFSKEALLSEIENHPERFSPNVLLRPLFKELLLPNLAMIGGGAEVNYWMQLKSTFSFNKIVYPILMLRNSVLIANDTISKKVNLLGFDICDFFYDDVELHKRYMSRTSDVDININSELVKLDDLFSSLLSKTIDEGVKSSILAEKQKQVNALKKIEHKLLKLEKQKHQNALSQISVIKTKLFPNNVLQERHENFIPFYLKYGVEFFDLLKKELKLFERKFILFSDY
tara:strand:- start:526 stop:2100 length:1575 start_codon:yes stop_codon:yes gene_type:complete